MSTEANGDRQRFFHSTHLSAAVAILANGFRDNEGYYMTSQLWKGVYFSEWPLDEGDGHSNEALFEISMPGDIDLSQYELPVDLSDYGLPEDVKTYREWCIPASLIKENAELRQVGDEEACDMRRLLPIPKKWPDSCPDCETGVLQLADEKTFDSDVQVGQCPDCGFQSLRRAP